MFVGFGETGGELSSSELQRMAETGEKILKVLASPAVSEAAKAPLRALVAAAEAGAGGQFAGLSGFGTLSDLGDYGSVFKKVTRYGKRLTKRVSRVTRLPFTVVRKAASGDIKGAIKAAAVMSNPIATAAQVVTNDTRKLDWARTTMPTSVIAIENKDLRKKAAIGYAAAAVIAGGVAAAGGMSLTAGTAAGTTGTGATGAAGVLAKGKSIASAVQSAKSAYETARGGGGEATIESGGGLSTQQQAELRKPWLKYTIIGVSSITVLGIAYYLLKGTKEA